MLNRDHSPEFSEYMTEQQPSGKHLFLGRQPIVDRDQAMVGYEFMFRPPATPLTDAFTPLRATASVVCNTFAELGLAQAIGVQRAFIDVDAEFLCDDLVQLLPAESVVLQVAAPLAAHPTVMTRCHELHGAGYAFAVSGCEGLTTESRPLLALASYAKLEVLATAEHMLAGQISQLRSLPLQLIATRVENPDAHALARRLGFDAYQGYFFARPTLVSGRKLDVGTQTLLRLIRLINDDADVSALEGLLKGEPGLVANLLRLTNSVGVGLATKVTSIRQAINVLGRRQLCRWLQLLLFTRHSGGSSIRNNPLMQLAALRGHFLELLVQRCYPARPQMQDPAFLVGLMSVMPAALEMPMAEILEQLPVAGEVREALQSRSGQLGQLLSLVEAYDDNDTEGAAGMLAAMGGRLGQQTLNLCLTEAIAWMLSLADEAA